MKQSKYKKSLLDEKRNRKGYLFILPFVVGFVTIFLPCLFKSLYYAFSSVTLTKQGFLIEAAGWSNFHRLFFVDINFRVMLLSAIKNIIIDTLLVMIFSFFVANILNQKFIGRSFIRAILFLPVILSTGLISAVEFNDLTMSMYMNAGESAVRDALTTSGSAFELESLLLSVSSEISPSLITFLDNSIRNTTGIINASGVQILIFMAALQSIPVSVFEASKVEGATKWQEFWKITFPILTPMIFVNLIFTIIDTFTRPSYQILETVNQLAFDKNSMGLASAFSWVFFILIAITLVIVTAFISPKIHYEN